MAGTKVCIDTSKGLIIIELYNEKAPKTVENFLKYVNSNFYSGTIFHRVIKKFMIQGGGLTSDMEGKENNEKPVINEADNGLKNLRGTISMARTSDPQSATSQFFINTADNVFLDFREKTIQGWGYCVFGKVIQGMDIVDKIENAETTTISYYKDVPLETITINKMTVAQ